MTPEAMGKPAQGGRSRHRQVTSQAAGAVGVAGAYPSWPTWVFLAHPRLGRPDRGIEDLPRFPGGWTGV